MAPADFRAELRTALISYSGYDGILKVPGAAGRPEAQIIKRRFHAQAAPAPPADAAAPAGRRSTPGGGAPACLGRW